jgi:bacteriorhodopsin
MAIELVNPGTQNKTQNPPPNPEKAKKNATVKFSFMFTYILLLTTATITFIEAIRTKTPYIRHILNLETAISVIAGYFYGVFIAQIDKCNDSEKDYDWKEISQTRYVDWAITTPLMLLTLCLVLSKEINVAITLPAFLIIVGLNYLMLGLGYLGETGVLQRTVADITGFGAFFAMFFLIYRWYVAPKSNKNGTILFSVYLFLWSLYGVVYLLDEVTKNTVTNFLDLTAKCLVGLGLWVYYTKIIR